jgi:RNA polymerase sigma-70 factor (TIGR02960 family)
MQTITDDTTFSRLADAHRREIHVHAYRMLGSFDEAEDAVQETMLRAWRSRESFDGSAAFRAWLYRIATNVCLDAIRRTNRRPKARSLESLGEVSWLQPYPDRLLDEIAPPDTEPDSVAVARETIELAFLAVIQLLPARQRAVLILRDVLDWSATETADLLEMTSAGVNSALQRARATMAVNRPHGRTGRPPATPTREELEIVRRTVAAHEKADGSALAEMLRDDVRIAMPPLPYWFSDKASFVPDLESNLRSAGEWRLVPVGANRSPAVASYLRAPGDSEFRGFKIDVIRVEDGAVAEITTFGPALFPAFGLPQTLD